MRAFIGFHKFLGTVAVYDQRLSTTNFSGFTFSFDLCGAAITPALLREFSDKLEEEMRSYGFDMVIPLPEGNPIPDSLMGRTVNCVNPEKSGGESLILVTDIYRWSKTEAIFKQELSLHSYCNSSTLKGISLLVPEEMRVVADALEKTIKETGLEYE